MMHALVLFAFLTFASRRFLTYLHIFQQDEYDNARFLRWLFHRRVFDRKASIALLVAGLVEFAAAGVTSTHVAPLSTVVVLLGIAAIERNPLKDAKKKLSLTARAKRILSVGAIVLVSLGTLLAILGAPLLLWILAIQGVPFAMIAANVILQPFENQIQRRFWREAHEKITELKPTVIAITGSFGKTSIKHILGHILNMQAPTLITPGSVNTPMGIARVLREQLVPRYHFLVCEMGAYGPGSIRRLCNLVPPSMGIITSIGHAHYERFRSLDAVARTKFELAEEVESTGGHTIVAAQALEIPYAEDFVARHRDGITVVGIGKEADVEIVATRQTTLGVETDVVCNGEKLTLKAPLFGQHHATNLAIAFAAARNVGLEAEDILLALSTTPQIKHRLEIVRQPDGGIVIDDAYNSNPTGFASALGVLDALRTNTGRRILVTPGMVELGAAHDSEHQRIGTLAARYVDVLLAIIPARIESLISSYTSENRDGIVVPCQSFDDAQNWLNANRRPDDVVLLENDLPDLYETRLSL